jgi:hypothetical protein
MPLAIELAAARMRALSVEQIHSRLDDSIALLAGGGPLAPSRQQALRATLDWSYRLLDTSERAVFRRMAVFAESCTLEAVEAVCSDKLVRPNEVLVGDMPHDFTLSDGVAQATKIEAAGGQTARGTLEIDKPGTYQFVCSQPAHALAGMRGTMCSKRRSHVESAWTPVSWLASGDYGAASWRR